MSDSSSAVRLLELGPMRGLLQDVERDLSGIIFTAESTAASLSKQTAQALDLRAPLPGTQPATEGAYLNSEGQSVYAQKDTTDILKESLESVEVGVNRIPVSSGTCSMIHVYTDPPSRSRGKIFSVYLENSAVHPRAVKYLPRYQHEGSFLWPILKWTKFSLLDPRGYLSQVGGSVVTYLLYEANAPSTAATTEPDST